MDEELSPTGYHSIATVYFLLALASFSLNSIVILTFVLDRSLLFQTNLLVLSIAISDWLMGVVANPMGGAANASGSASFGPGTSCTFYGFFTTLLGLGSMLHHAAFAVDRYLVISRPMDGPHTIVRMLTVIGSLWAFALMWSVFPLLGWSAYVPEGGDIACSIRWQSTRSADTSYIACLFIFFYFIPLALIVSCYSFMFSHVRYMTRNAQRMWGANAAATLETVQASWRMAKVGLTMVIGFFFAWTPYAVVSFYAAFGSADNVPILVAAIPSLFAKTSTLYNPIIYFFTYKAFRESLVSSWRRHRNRNGIQPVLPSINQHSNQALVVNSGNSRHRGNSTSVEDVPM